MKALCIEAVVTHDESESCVAIREGGGEALTGVRAGRAIEPRNNCNRCADAISMSVRQNRWQRYRELTADPARSKNQGMYAKLHAREPGEPMFARPVDHRTGRSGKAMVVSLR